MKRKLRRHVRSSSGRSGQESQGAAHGQQAGGLETTGPTSGATTEIERPSELKLSRDIEDTRGRLRELLGHSDDLIQHDLVLGGQRGTKCTVYYYQAMANADFLHAHIITPLKIWGRPQFYDSGPRRTLEEITARVIVGTEINTVDNLGGIMDGLFVGHGALLVDGFDRAVIVRAAGYQTRPVGEPSNETSIRGPAEGFTENMETNTSMIRRRYKSPHLVVENLLIGDESRTRIRLCFDRHLAPPAIVAEVRKRLASIKRDGVHYSATVEYLIADHPYALWPTIERTERPDRVADQLLQGRVAVIVDNNPFALVLPTTASVYFWAADDQTESFYFSSLMRLLRMLALVLSAFGTPVYVSLVSYHPEMIPLPLLLNIAAGQEGVPLPLVLTALVMELVIEVVREAGIRLPRPVGSAVSIVGTIVIGEAAITAGFAPPGLVVVVAISAIGSFALPDYGAAVAFRLLRFPALMGGAVLGIYGVTTVAMLALFDLTSIKTFGVPFLAMYTPGRGRQILETAMIAPPRATQPTRRVAYRDRYRTGKPPRVRSRLPILEKSPKQDKGKPSEDRP